MKNKNIWLLFVVAFLMIPTALLQAQAALFILIFGDKVASEKFHLSLDLGLNVSNMSGFDDGNSLTGFYFGLGTHLKLNDHWYFAPEFKPLSPKGAADVRNPITIPEEYEGSETKSDIRLNYIDIPLLAQYRLNNGFYFSTGPQISFLSRAKQKTTITLPSGTLVDVEQDLKDNFKNIDWSVPVEIGYALKSSRGGKGLDIRLRYTYGLGEVFENNPNNYSANHSTFQFLVTFPFVEVATEE